jgi:hypothetical protein
MGGGAIPAPGGAAGGGTWLGATDDGITGLMTVVCAWLVAVAGTLATLVPVMGVTGVVGGSVATPGTVTTGDGAGAGGAGVDGLDPAGVVDIEVVDLFRSSRAILLRSRALSGVVVGLGGVFKDYGCDHH